MLILDWIQTYGTALWWLATASIIAFVATVVFVPLFLVRIPPDYFAHRRRSHTPWADHHPLVRGMLFILKNALGCIFIPVGVAPLALPGQGILTILAGIMLLDFPGKYTLESWVISRRPVLQSINWLRRRAEKPPLALD